MASFFGPESSLFEGLSKMTDRVFLNLLVIFFSIPIVTVGAAQAALYEVTARLGKGEGGVWKLFWMSFRLNFKQATLQWLILLGFGLVSGWGLFATVREGLTIPFALFGLMLALTVSVFSWCFPFQSRFINPVGATLRNALMFSVLYLPRTILMVIINGIPWVMLVISPVYALTMVPLWLLIWFSLTGYLNLKLLKKPFAVLEGMVPKEQDQ